MRSKSMFQRCAANALRDPIESDRNAQYTTQAAPTKNLRNRSRGSPSIFNSSSPTRISGIFTQDLVEAPSHSSDRIAGDPGPLRS
jgi:hypothetical protein